MFTSVNLSCWASEATTILQSRGIAAEAVAVVVKDRPFFLLRDKEGRHDYPVRKNRFTFMMNDSPDDLSPEDHAAWALCRDLEIESETSLPTLSIANLYLQATWSGMRISQIQEINMESLRGLYPVKGDGWNSEAISFLCQLTDYLEDFGPLLGGDEGGFPLIGNIPCPPMRSVEVEGADEDRSEMPVEHIVKVIANVHRYSGPSVSAQFQELVDKGVASWVDCPPAGFLSPSFGIVQGGKTRPISDYSYPKKGTVRSINRRAVLDHKLSLPRIQNVGFAANILTQGRFKFSDLTIRKLDHDSAYTQIPLRESDRHLTCLAVKTETGVRFLLHHSAPFGGLASMSDYIRVSSGINHFGRSLMLGACPSYVDDFYDLQPDTIAASSMVAFEELNDIVGAKTKRAKTVRPAKKVELTGLIFECREEGILVAISEERRKSLIEDIEAAEQSDFYSSKLLGRISFCLEGVFGRCGRGYVRSLISKSRGATIDTSGVVCQLKSLFTDPIRPRLITDEAHGSELPDIVLYTDASGVDEVSGYAGMGSVCYFRDSDSRPVYTAYSVTSSLVCLDQTAATEATIIHSLETVALLNAIQTHIVAGGAGSNKVVHCYVDNETEKHVVKLGSSSSGTLNNLAALVWKIVMQAGCKNVLFGRVSTSCNPADWPSRYAEYKQKLTAYRRIPTAFVPNGLALNFSQSCRGNGARR